MGCRLERADAQGCSAALLLEQLDVALTLLDGVGSEDVRGARERVQQLGLDVAVVGEHHEPLAGFQERLYPLDGGVQLALRRHVTQCVQLDQRLRAQSAVDALRQAARVLDLVAQPVDQVLLEVAVVGLVRERHRHRDPPLGRQLREHFVLAPAHIAGAAQMPVQPLALLLPLEAALERRAAAEVAEPAEGAQLRDELARPVDQRSAGQR